MPLPDWVTDIPTVSYRPGLDDYQVDEAFGAVQSTDISPAGNMRMRDLTSHDWTTDNVKLFIGNATKLGLFLTWVRDNLHRGAATFTMPVPYNGTWVTRRCQIVNAGQGIKHYPGGYLNNEQQFIVEFKRRIEGLYRA